jgi:MerR family transcriptional regulator/heat shock protein HspR
MIDDLTPLLPIRTAAILAGMHPQTLRQYDRLGLVSPTRTAGQSRRYSHRDVARLREVARLSAEGLNLEGIRRILDLENQVLALTQRVRDLEATLTAQHRRARRVFAAAPTGDVTPVHSGTRIKHSSALVLWRPAD